MKKNSFKSLATVLSLAMAATALPVNANAAAAPKISVSNASVKQKGTGTVKISNIKKGYKVKFTSGNKSVMSLTGSKKSVTKTASGKTLSVKYTAGSAAKIVDSGKKKVKITAVVYNAKGKKVKTLTKNVKVSPVASTVTPKQPSYSAQVGGSFNAGIDLLVGSTDVSSYYTVTYASSDTSVVSNTNGGASFTANKEGTATITATATNTNGKTKTATMSVVVEAAQDQNKLDDQKPDDANKPDDNKPNNDAPVVSSKNFKLEVTAPAGTDLANFEADPSSQVTLTVKMTDTNNLISAESKDKVAFAVFLTREVDAGGLSKSDLTLTWNGKDAWEATTVFSGTKRDTAITVPISATLRNIEDIGNNVTLDAKEQLEGLTSENKLNISLVPPKANGSQNAIVRLDAVDVTCTSMDRLVITFNKELNFAPNGDFFDANGALAEGDRFHLAMNRNLTNNQITTGDWYYESEPGAISKTKYGGEAQQDSGIKKVVETVLSYPGDSTKAIFVLKNGYEMKDNSQFAIRYYDKATTNAKVLAGNTLDAVKPQVSRVEPDDTRKLTTIRVTFTKPVNMYTEEQIKDAKKAVEDDLIKTKAQKQAEKKALDDIWNCSAINPANYIIDSHRLTISWNRPATDKLAACENAFGAGNVKIKLTEGREAYRDSVDITLGTDGGQQRYFTTGDHLIQVTNVGDYAYLSDKATAENMIATETKGFNIPADTLKPQFKVIVQSPEQFILDFNCHLAEIDTVRVGNTLPSNLANRIQFLYKELLTEPNFTKNVADLEQTIRITNVTPTGQYNTRLKVEVEKDWTSLKGWKKDHSNYFSYPAFAFNITGDSFSNASNGLKADINVPIALAAWTNKEIMQSYDGKSPEVIENGLKFLESTDAGYVAGKTTLRITFNEPVQAGNKVFKDANLYTMNSSPITPAWTDKNGGTLVDVPEMEVEAVNNTTKKTYKADIKGYAEEIQEGLENYAIDATFINGGTTLPAGSYTVYVRAISDDIGNTMATQQRDVVYGEPTTETDFRVLAVLADKSYGAQHSRAVSKSSIILDDTGNRLNPDKSEEHDRLVLNNSETEDNANEQGEDAIYVEFSRQYGTKVGVSVLEESNWTLNGRPLPAGSRIVDGIADGVRPDSYHEPKFETVNDALKKTNPRHSGITIVVPNGTITDIYNTTLTLNKNVQDADNKVLSGPSTFYTPSVLDKTSQGAIINNNPSVFTEGESNGHDNKLYITMSEYEFKKHHSTQN